MEIRDRKSEVEERVRERSETKMINREMSVGRGKRDRKASKGERNAGGLCRGEREKFRERDEVMDGAEAG